MRVLFTLLCVTAISLSVLAGSRRNKTSEGDLRRYQQLYLESVCQREAGNKVAQYRLLERAVKVNPNGAEAYFDLAQMAARTAMPVPILQYLAKAHSLVPSNKDYTFEYARCLLSSVDERGIELMTTLTHDEEMREDAYMELCSYFQWQQDYDGLCQTLEQWRPIKADDEFISSRKLYSAMSLGRLDEALLIADTLMQRNPAHAMQYKVTKGEILLGLNREQEALDIYHTLDADEATNPGAQILLYKYALKTSDKQLESQILRNIIVNPDMAMHTREAALHQYMESAPANGREGRRDTLLTLLLPLPETDATLFADMLAQLSKEDTPDSLYMLVFNKMLEINPADEYARISLMQIALRNDDYTEVERLCTDGLKENPKQPLFYFFGGAGMMTAKNYEEALQLFERGRQYISSDTNTELVSSYYGSYGDALHQLGRNAEAYAMYDSALVYNNGNEMCLNNYAYFLALDNEQLDKAERMSAYTVESRPEEATFLDTYAWILFLKGDYEKAREYIDKALQHIADREEDDNSSLYDHAGDIYYHLGLTAVAVGYWQEALKMNPENADLIKKKIANKKYYKN